MFDKPYLALFMFGDDGLFHHTETVKLENTGAGRSENGGQDRISITVQKLAKDGPTERCPWCGVKGGTVHCPRCDNSLCPGLTTESGKADIFRCRASCGYAGEIDNSSYHPNIGSRGPVTRGGQSKETLPASDRNKLKA
jgi:hypothetical protein